MEQRLESNSEDIANTLTTVQKDNMVLEVETDTGFLGSMYDQHSRWGVFDKEKVSPTLTAAIGMGGGHTPMITEVDAYDEQNQTVRKDTFGTLTTDGSSPKHNNRVIQVRQATKDGLVPCRIGGVVDLTYPDSKTRRGRVIENGEVCPTLTTENIPSVLEDWIWEVDGQKYLIRIRKLTPRECWRLMDFTDEDFDKAQMVNSNTQLYKQAGNSIVKNVLCEVFRQLIEREESN